MFAVLVAMASGYAAEPAADHSKASKIILPKVQFAQATVNEALAFFRAKSRELDADKAGVTIILVASEKAKQAKVDLDLLNVSMADAVKYFAIAAGLEMSQDGEAIVLKSI
ncbi:MAG: hypothetical protein ACOYMN_08770 [Roseimicrobium sp.]